MSDVVFMLRLLRGFAISRLPFTVFVLLVIWSEYWCTDDDLRGILLLVSVPAILAFFLRFYQVRITLNILYCIVDIIGLAVLCG